MVLLAGPLVAIVGIVAIFFVLRRKSVEKRSMYSARREQIEHKVRAARQRTLAPHGHAPKPAEQPAAAPAAPVSAFDQPQVQPTVTYQYQAPAYEAPPAAPPAPPKPEPAPSAPMPWDTPSAPAPTQAPASTGWDFPPATAAPEPYTPAPAPEPFRPAREPAPAAPSEPVWTPAPSPAEPKTPAPTVAPAASSTAAGSWSVVSSTKESAATAEHRGKSKDKGAATGSWQLASGDALGMDAEEVEGKRPSGTIVAVAQYAVLVVGLVMVLIGVLVMVANSHVT